MKAVMFVPAPGGASVEVREIDAPKPSAGEALVRVRAAGLNRGELVVRRSLRSGPPQQTGIEFAGEVAALGPGCSRVKAGDRVMGHWKGGQAEYVACDERLLVPVPARLTWIEAGAWLNVFTTAHDAIVTNAGLRRGESILVNAASSGIGVAALQIARLLGARPVIASSRSKAKLEKLGAFGMDVGVAAGDTAAVLAATGNKGVDVLIDSVGGASAQANLEATAILGRIVSVGRLGGNTSEIDLDLLAYKRAKLIGVTFRTRTKEERIACVQRCAEDLLSALAEGRIGPVVHEVFPLAKIAAAHEAMERNEHLGKIVIELA
ncbi:MAG: zinc-binding dehydrogenase [Betaproteobacteria bacterium]|nr:zinc-binding dehydrogenase [Betaproteobacteria bacterium]